MTLRTLLHPRSIAIVGLSPDRSKHGHRVLNNLRKVGFGGTIFGINPRGKEVPGVAVFRSLTDVPEPPDVAICAVPAIATPNVARAAAQRGVGTMIVFAGGFAESGAAGAAIQGRLAAVVEAGGLRMLGPNSGGVIVADGGAAMSFLTCLDRPADEIRSGPVGLVTQSGGTGSYIHNLAAARGGGLAASISTGNEIDIDVADGIEALADLETVRAIAVVLETVRDGPRLITAVEGAHRRGKPVVVSRIGTSQRGGIMTQSHTGALARPARVLDGVCRTLGVAQVATPAELLDVAEMSATGRRSVGRRVGVITHSGGIAIMLADLAEHAGLELPPPSPELAAAIERFVQQGSVANPVDMGGIIGGPGRFGEAVATFADSGEFDVVLAVSSAHPPAHSVERARSLLAVEHPVPVVHLWMAGDVGAEGLQLLRDGNAIVTDEPRAAIAALRALTTEPGVGTSASDHARAASRGVLEAPGRSPMTEKQAKELVARWGVPVVDGEVVTTGIEAVAAADRLGYPVVVKISSADIVHKTEVGGVRVGLGGPEGVQLAYEDITSKVQRDRPDAVVDGVLVERQIDGLELLIGAVRDPTFGPMVLVGSGGQLAEALDDVQMSPFPCSESRAREMIGGLRALSRLTEPRQTEAGRGDPADIDGLASLIVELGSRLADDPSIKAVELNPLVWHGTGWLALDAFIESV